MPAERRSGLDATDLVGGFQAWLAAGLPVERLNGDRSRYRPSQ